MQNFKRNYPLILALILLASCGGKQSSGVMEFTIEGTLSNAASKTLYIEEVTPDNGAQFVDSIACDKHGHFKWKGSMGYQTFFNLHSSLYDYIVLLPNEGENIEISGDAEDLSDSYLVNNSPESRLMWQIQSYINHSKHAIADIIETDRQNRATLNDADYELAHQKPDSIFIAEHTTVYLMYYNFIEDNLGSLSTLYAIDAPFNHNGRVFYAEPDFEVFETVLEGLQESAPDNPHTQYFKTNVERARSARVLSLQQQQPGQEIIIE